MKYKDIPQQDLFEIIEFVKKEKKEKFLTSPTLEFTQKEKTLLDRITKRYNNEEPLAYILGYKYFYNSKFKVSPDVLIPRPETEILVDFALKEVSNSKNKVINILEVGAGSGCISISILNELDSRKHNKKVTIFATDISTKALEIAAKNAKSILSSKAKKSLKLQNADIYPNGTNIKFDIIISNPPYIPSHLLPSLAKSVQNHEPTIALDGGKTGIDFYKTIIEKTRPNQKSDTIFLFEVDETSLESLNHYLNKLEKKYEIFQDLQGRQRVMRLR